MEKKLYKFYADWCGPCKMMKPVAEKLAADSGIELVEVNIDESIALVHHYDIQGVPTLILVEDDQEVARVTGMNTQQRLATALGL